MKKKSFQGNLIDVFLFNIKGVLNLSCERERLVNAGRYWKAPGCGEASRGLFAGRLTGPVLPDTLVGIQMNT